MIRSMRELVAEQPLLLGLPPAMVDLVAGCAHNASFPAEARLLSEGEAAETFYLIRRGRVALEIARPGDDPFLIETIEHGVVGWSWLFPPYRWHFDARAVIPVEAIALDGGCLRAKAEHDPALGYELTKRMSAVILDRLQATRMRLLDVYGDVRSA